jgi:hypothetical protein
MMGYIMDVSIAILRWGNDGIFIGFHQPKMWMGMGWGDDGVILWVFPSISMGC